MAAADKLRTRFSGRNSGGMTMCAPARKLRSARFGTEEARVAAAERAGGPWWDGPTWVRVRPGFYGGEVGQVDIYDTKTTG